ncbi:RagB/SusD family nutrient uptake outer membrane protein [Chitinophaga tropicalis]|uniref:RagB/SusD family nutrient uptake outer membrane protein n=1 Tax=Chitinophaga tropicalis TaxID=2683588 RepID=A0A7K1U3A3_9BACT|nr:RagB/SusD family nutrient uptake outer membrane protein [Chitinophaga tropicalis]MVT08844.1 RagB/SusD family nutrient uptake outer membrane protein [Chitinophaga tropicalis]
MKNNIYFLLLLSMIWGGVSCQDDFLQMPVSNTTTTDSVFSTSIKAQNAIANAYQKALNQGLPYQGNWNSLIQDNISGALTYGFSWTWGYGIATSTGLTASGNIEDMDGFGYNFTAIRQAYLVKENIDKVTDMSAADKAVVKAEMQALVAYRYEQMFIMYGGVPILSKSLNVTDDLSIPRAPLKEVLDSIIAWCDAAIPVLPSQWPATWTGRMTKAAAQAIKAKALLYAARPLFNTGTPYLDFGANNNLICLGSTDASLWQRAATAAEDVIREAETNSGAVIINTGNPLDDYGTATSTPSNPEVLLAYKHQAGGMNTFYNMHNWQAYGNGLTSNYLRFYYKADGTDQAWPSTSTAFSDYLTRMQAMEPRFKACFQAWEINAWNNPNDNNWSTQKLFQWQANYCAFPVKFYYKAGTRSWFEFPIFRLAAAYLSAAEAYNEVGQTTEALQRLNVIHLRAGLPAITETDKDKLRSIIQREWAVEFFDENYWLHDIKHWKRSDIGNGLIGGPIRALHFNSKAGGKLSGNTDYEEATLYQGFWAPRQYLNPFPQTEINKGTLIQNPGY